MPAVEFHASNVRPLEAHAPGHAHAVGGIAPPGQKDPFGHAAPAGPDDQPAGHPQPGCAVQLPLHALLVRLNALPHRPAGHCRGYSAFGGQ